MLPTGYDPEGGGAVKNREKKGFFFFHPRRTKGFTAYYVKKKGCMGKKQCH